MLKELLISEAKEIEASVELDSVFESVNLSDEAKANFSTVFEATVKKHAVQLAESHITKIAELAESQVQEGIEAAKIEAEATLTESASKFFDHIAKEWLAENKIAIDRGIKGDLFESMLTGMKELFVEHNVVIPAESVDVVAEMEEELAEANAETTKLFESNVSLTAEIASMKRDFAITEMTRDLTESQKESVTSLTEGMDYSDAFTGKLTAIVEMVKTSKDKTITEGVINTPEDDAAKLNFVSEAVDEKSTKAPSVMDAYIRGATRLS
ncbi:head scaffolding protein [Escherichia phage EcS1]|uniref:Prohead core scaffold protein n=1 Tax=Escherichia phage EcS1 TaxID=2083276 RepID=A0A2Z5ZC65_9CAUD|nr:head scaffolding protein [Escherichia phage EcS1]BBC78240.1 Prohead core scaffold protein [Escherichia phage EcS1]